MRSFRSEPILWLHVAGLATLPVFLGLCLFFLSIGSIDEPLAPKWLEILLVAAIGVVPVLWMQLRRPFYIFAILGVAIKPDKLNDKQLKILSLINKKLNRSLVIVAAVILVLVLLPIYSYSLQLASLMPVPAQWRSLGLLLAGLSFLGSNLFWQIPLSVAGVFVASETEFNNCKVYPVERIAQDFTILGVRVNQILPQFTEKNQTED
jgi:hypothetical protein